MDYDAAYDRLELYALPEDDPTLSEADLASLIEEHARTVDEDDNEPSSDDWTPTYGVTGVYIAIAAAWDLKASKAAGRFDFTTDGQQFRRSQVVDHCQAMADRYRRKAAMTTRTGG